MSMALAHFGIGSALTILLVTFLVPNVTYPRVLALVGGGWGMVPDVHWISPVFAEQFHSVHSSRFADVFWFHNTLDVLDASDSKLVAAGALGALFVATAIAENRSYRALETVRDLTSAARSEP